MKRLLKKTCQPILIFCALFLLALLPETSADADYYDANINLGTSVTVTVDYDEIMAIVTKQNAELSKNYRLDADLTEYAIQLAADIGSGYYTISKPGPFNYIETRAQNLFSYNGNKKTPVIGGYGFMYSQASAITLDGMGYDISACNLVGVAKLSHPEFKWPESPVYFIVFGSGTCTPVTQSGKVTKAITIGAKRLSSGNSTGTNTNTNTNTGTNTNTPSNPSSGNASAPSAGLTLRKTVSGENYSVTVAYTQTTGNNKAKKPAITVKYNGKKVKAKYYTVKYSSNKYPGLATVTVKGKGSYKSKIPQTKLQFVIKPAKMKAPTTKAGKGALTVSWKKQSKVTGYEVQISASKNFKSIVQSFTATSNKSKTIKNLTRKKTYYVRTRAYKNIQGTVYYGNWSSAKKVKTK